MIFDKPEGSITAFDGCNIFCLADNKIVAEIQSLTWDSIEGISGKLVLKSWNEIVYHNINIMIEVGFEDGTVKHFVMENVRIEFSNKNALDTTHNYKADRMIKLGG